MRYLNVGARLLTVIATVAVVLTTLVSPVQATPYGSNTYNACVYNCPPEQSNTNTPSAPTQTVATTPSGLNVAINLVDGQEIPRSGYEVVITPLNGSGSSFKSITIYVDGKQIFQGTPGADGTLRWPWDVARYPGNVIRIDIEDQSGAITSKTYNIKVVDTPAQPTGGSASPEQSADGSGSFLSSAIDEATEFVKALPAPVVYGFPYFLLLLLAINVIIISYQAIREIKEYRILLAILERGRTVAEAKKTLAQLVSHYLRTPLTLMMGGVDMLKQDPAFQAAASKFEPILTQLHLKIEGLITQTVEASTVTHDTISTGNPQAGVLRQPGLLIPLIAIPLLAVPFNFLAARAGTFTISQINIATQIIVFSILIGLVYTLLRFAALRHRDKDKLSEVLAAEAAVQTSRDTLITQTAAAIEQEVAAVDAAMAEVQGDQATAFIQNGQNRLKDMLSKLTVAGRLKGTHTQADPQSVAFTTLVNPIYAQLQAKAAEKQVTLTPVYEHTLTVRSPELVAYMLTNIIDNAIAYSHDKGKVEVTLEEGEQYHIQVTDHGVGVQKERLALLFQPFSKAEGAEVFTHEGMGFSLYLDTLVTSYLGGKISIDSEPNVATEVHIWLPKAT